jgi:tetratricopeptide (TPR) repeat protein
MSDIFIAHVEEDAEIALEIALGLEEGGYTTWCYEIDSIPGPSYLIQTGHAVEQVKAVVVIISPHSLGSRQVTKEIVRAHESDKEFIPVLRDISHIEFQNRQSEWREAIGAAASINIPREGISVILPRIIDGLKALGIQPGNELQTQRISLIQQELSNRQENKRLLEEARAAEEAAKEKAKQQAEEAAREQVRQEAEEAAREKARQEAEEVAMEQARQQAEEAAREKARQEAEESAREKTKREIEEARKKQVKQAAEEARQERERLAAEEAAKKEALRQAKKERALAEKTTHPAKKIYKSIWFWAGFVVVLAALISLYFILKPGQAEQVYQEGVSLLSQGQFEQAILKFNEAIQMDTSLAAAYHDRGLAYAKQGFHKLALADLTRAVELNPDIDIDKDYAIAYYDQGLVYANQGSFDPAISDLTKALEINPDITIGPAFAVAYKDRGLAYSSQGFYDLAIADYTRAIELDGNYTEAFLLRAGVYALTGKYDSALADADKAIALSPDDSDCYYKRGDIYRQMGDVSKAIANFEKSLGLAKNMEDTERAQQAIEQLKG